MTRTIYLVQLPNGKWYKNHAQGYPHGVSFDTAQIFHQRPGAVRAARRLKGRIYEFALDTENYTAIEDPNK